MPASGKAESVDQKVADKGKETVNQYIKFMDEVSFSRALFAIWEFIALVNKYIDDTAPWSLSKKGETERLATILYNCCESIRIISILVYPFMPGTAENIWEKLGSAESIEQTGIEEAKKWGLIKSSTAVAKGSNLFQKL